MGRGVTVKTSDLRRIREMWVHGKSMRHIAQVLGISHQSVARAVNREKVSLEPLRQENVKVLVDHFIGSFQGMTSYQHIARGLSKGGRK